MFNCFSCVGESVWCFSMVNVWAGEAAISGIATECAGRGLGCVVVVSGFHYFDCIIIYLHIILSSIFNCLEFSPNFLHSRFTPFFSLRCVALLPQCWAERILEHWNDCKPKSTLGREKSHKCFKICDEDCSLASSFVSFYISRDVWLQHLFN